MKQRDNVVKPHQVVFIILSVVVCFLFMVYVCKI